LEQTARSLKQEKGVYKLYTLWQATGNYQVKALMNFRLKILKSFAKAYL